MAKRNALPYVPYHLQVGQRLPGHEEYRNERLLGQGGMGSVYEMVRGELEFRVAAKIMHRDLAARPEFVKMFLEEARILKQVGDHPNIVRILDYSKLADGTPFIVMELLQGQSLGGFTRLRAGKPFEREAAFGIIGETLEGVFELHSQGIIHRDLKPDNIYLQLRHTAGDDSAVKILDCGLAYKQDRAQDSTVQGTPRYMAPEQVRGLPVSPQTDIYAMGVILYEMLVGHLPFELKSESTKDLLDAHLWKSPIQLSQFIPWLSPAANAVIMSALDKDPTKRPRSAFEFQSQLYLEADRLRKGLPPESGVDANTTTPPDPYGLPVCGIPRQRRQRRRGASRPHAADEATQDHLSDGHGANASGGSPRRRMEGAARSPPRLVPTGRCRQPKAFTGAGLSYARSPTGRSWLVAAFCVRLQGDVDRSPDAAGNAYQPP